MVDHRTDRSFVQVVVVFLSTPYVVVLEARTFLEEATPVQTTHECFYRSPCPQSHVRQHRTIGYTIHFTHQLHFKGEGFSVGVLLGFLVIGHGNQGIQGVHLFTPCIYPSQNSFTMRLRHFGTRLAGVDQSIHRLLQGDGLLPRLFICRLRIEQILGCFQGGRIGLLVRLNPQTFRNAQHETVGVLAIYRSLPVCTGNHPAMDLARLWIDRAINTYPLLLPDGVWQIESLICSQVFEVFHRRSQLTTKCFITHLG